MYTGIATHFLKVVRIVNGVARFSLKGLLMEGKTLVEARGCVSGLRDCQGSGYSEM